MTDTSPKIPPDAKSPDAKSPEGNPLTTLAALAGEWVEAAEAATIGLFEAEVGALNTLLQPRPTLDPAAKAAEAQKEEADTEAGFDNLPV